MSNKDEKKEYQELSCFETAIALSRKGGGQTYDILKYLDGKAICREKKDRPDIVRLCTKGKKKPREILVGIEHFRVDQLSKEFGGKRVSKNAEYLKHIQNAYDNGHQELMQTNDISEQVQTELLNQISGLAQENVRKCYSTLVDDFSYNLSNHLSKVEQYKENLKEFAKGIPVELAFLIEVHASFPPLFLNNDNSVAFSPKGKLIIFKDLADEIAKISNKQVDYIIILYYDCGSDIENATDVLAFRTGKIQDHLMRQGVSIYKYAGGNIKSKNGFNKSIVKWTKNPHGDYNVIAEYDDVDEKEAMDSIYHALYVAYYSKKNNIPFVTSREVQSLLEAFWSHIDGFTVKDGYIEPLFKDGTNYEAVSMQYATSLEKYKRMSDNDYGAAND